jgi:hypothetical protein
VIPVEDLFCINAAGFAEIGIKGGQAPTVAADVLDVVQHGGADMACIIDALFAELAFEGHTAFKGVAKMSAAACPFVAGGACVGFYKLI